MRSFVDLDRTFGGQPRELGATLARVDTGRGQEQLFLDQRPELLKRLSENARIASITASNAIEGVVVDDERAERLHLSQRRWHEGQHEIWPWVTYLAQVVEGAYTDFERRVAAAGEPEGSKQDRVRRHILEEAPEVFRRREIERALPEVSPATIRLVVNALRDSGEIVAEGAGPSARWRRV